MPRYKVLKKGFYDGKTYDPIGKRKILHTTKPFKSVPKWLEPIKAETAAEEKKRITAEKKAASAAAKKTKQDQKDIDNMTFLGDGEKSGTNNIPETL